MFIRKVRQQNQSKSVPILSCGLLLGETASSLLLTVHPWQSSRESGKLGLPTLRRGNRHASASEQRVLSILPDGVLSERQGAKPVHTLHPWEIPKPVGCKCV